MNTKKSPLRSSCSKKCNRRSFIFKSIYTSLGIGLSTNLLMAVPFSSSANKKQDEEIFKVLDELVDKYFPIFGTWPGRCLYTLPVSNKKSSTYCSRNNY